MYFICNPICLSNKFRIENCRFNPAELYMESTKPSGHGVQPTHKVDKENDAKRKKLPQEDYVLSSLHGIDKIINILYVA